MNDFPITYLRKDGRDEPVVAFHDRLLIFELPESKESFLTEKFNYFKRVFTGGGLSHLHALSSGVHFNLPRVNAYQYCERELRDYLDHAILIAEQHSNSYLTNSHLILALLKETFVQCLFTKRLEIPLEVLSQQLASNIATLPNGQLEGIDTQLAKIMLKAAGIAHERGAELIKLIDVLTALVGYDLTVEQIFRKYGYFENDRENIVTWLKLTAGTCSSMRIPKINLIRRLLLWVSPVNYQNAELVVARDLEVSRVMQEILEGNNFIILQAENGVGIDALIGAINLKHQAFIGSPLLELYVSKIAQGASATTLEHRFQSVFSQLLLLKHPTLVIRGFDELLGVAGSTGFDFTSMLSKIALQKRLTVITVLNAQALSILKENNLFKLAKIVEVKSLDQNGKIQLLMAQLANLEETTTTMISYGAIKIFVERLHDNRPRYLINRLKNFIPQNNSYEVEHITTMKMNVLLSQAGL